MINNTNTTYKSAHRRKIIIAYVEVIKNVLRSITYLTKNIFLQAQDGEIAGYSLKNKIKKEVTVNACNRCDDVSLENLKANIN